MEDRYNSIDGLRALSCLAIIAMHILYNTEYQIDGFIYKQIIPSFTWLVYLFLMISGFGMCAGYLTRFQNGQVNLESFYKRRYGKIMPFFGFLIIIALVTEPSITNIYEASIEILLLHGLLPNNTLNVLGVCWTLGVISLFYLLFPAYSVLLKTKKRAVIAFGISLWINFVCQDYFFGDQFVTELFTPRHSFIYCIPLFIGGGLVYLYRQMIRNICEKFRWMVLSVCVSVTVLYYVFPHTVGTVDISFYVQLIVFILWLSYAVGVNSKFLGCKLMKYLSSISMEMYLAQMVIFRAIEKCHLLYIIGDDWTGYIMAFVFTVAGLILFIECYKLMVKILKKLLESKDKY